MDNRDVFGVLEDGALSQQGIDDIGAYDKMIEKLSNNEVNEDEMRLILIDLYKCVNNDRHRIIELAKEELVKNGLDENTQTYGLDDYAMANLYEQIKNN